jgi:hypothetical protein
VLLTRRHLLASMSPISPRCSSSVRLAFFSAAYMGLLLPIWDRGHRRVNRDHQMENGRNLGSHTGFCQLHGGPRPDDLPLLPGLGLLISRLFSPRPLPSCHLVSVVPDVLQHI